MSDHEEIRELIAAYALDALDPEDSARVQAHLPRCASCRRELASFLRVADQIALSTRDAGPARDLETRILREASLVPRPVRARRAWGWTPGFAVAAAVLVFVLAAGNVAQWVRSPQFQARTKGLVTVALVGTVGHKDAYGTIVVDTDDSEGVMAVRGLPQLSPGSRYQLWLTRDGETLSGGLFTVNPDGYGSLLVKVPGGFRGFRAFGVSIEPQEGSSVPRGSMIMRGGL